MFGFFYLRAGLSSDILQCLKQAKLRNFNAVLVDSQESLLMLMDLRKSLVPYTIFYDADPFDRGPSSRSLSERNLCYTSRFFR